MDESLEVSCDSSSPLAALGPAYRRLGWIPVCDEQTPRLAPEAMSRRGDLSFTLLVKLLAVPSSSAAVFLRLRRSRVRPFCGQRFGGLGLAELATPPRILAAVKIVAACDETDGYQHPLVGFHE